MANRVASTHAGWGSRSLLTLVITSVLSVPLVALATTPTPSSSPTPVACIGDCNGDGAVTIEELLTLVNLALGNVTNLSACPAAPAWDTGCGASASCLSASATISIAWIVGAVNNALYGCPVPQTPPPATSTLLPTVTPTSVPTSTVVPPIATPTLVLTDTPQPTATPTGTPTVTETQTPNATNTPTITPMATPTDTPQPTATATPTQTPPVTPTPTPTLPQCIQTTPLPDVPCDASCHTNCIVNGREGRCHVLSGGCTCDTAGPTATATPPCRIQFTPTPAATPCGLKGQPCCAGINPCLNIPTHYDAVCIRGTCEECGQLEEPCCGDFCVEGLCIDGYYCGGCDENGTSCFPPVIAFFGVTRADDTLVWPSSTRADGVPIFERESDGFSLVVEGRPGRSGSPIGLSTFNWNPTDPTVVPYLLIESSQPLGNGSLDVCDDSAPRFGGVPAVNPADFRTTQLVANAINDFACRFKDGRGVPSGRRTKDACTAFPDGLFHFLFPPDPTVLFPSTVQFCGQIGAPLAFPTGDTLITARIRDLAGNVSSPAHLIIRVAP